MYSLNLPRELSIMQAAHTNGDIEIIDFIEPFIPKTMPVSLDENLDARIADTKAGALDQKL
jgi:hypothetical protein